MRDVTKRFEEIRVLKQKLAEASGMNFQPQILIQCSSAGEEQEYNDISAAPEAARGAPQQGNGNSRGGRR
jgi:hypothetical protein